jgi:hypothetical protein
MGRQRARGLRGRGRGRAAVIASKLVFSSRATSRARRSAALRRWRRIPRAMAAPAATGEAPATPTRLLDRRAATARPLQHPRPPRSTHGALQAPRSWFLALLVERQATLAKHRRAVVVQPHLQLVRVVDSARPLRLSVSGLTARKRERERGGGTTPRTSAGSAPREVTPARMVRPQPARAMCAR